MSKKHEAEEREVENPPASDSTMRDEFAKAALASAMPYLSLGTKDKIATASYEIADAMLKAKICHHYNDDDHHDHHGAAGHDDDCTPDDDSGTRYHHGAAGGNV